MKYLRLSWEEVDKACGDIARHIADSGSENPILIGISRGGLVPLRLFSDHLSSLDVRSMAISFYTDIAQTVDKPKIVYPVQGKVDGRSIILVDDVSDTGRSLIAAIRDLEKRGADKILVATIAKKPHTKLHPDYFKIETTSWVIFPWEVQETIKKIVEKSRDTVHAEKELEKAGIRGHEIKSLKDLSFGKKY